MLLAAKNAWFWIPDYVVKMGVDVNATDYYGRSALHWAVHHDNTALTRLLLERGARANAQDRWGKKGIDVTANGRWILCIIKNCLLLIDAQHKSGHNKPKLGFEKSFPANDKPQPRRLALTPEHATQYRREINKPVEFTPAKFNIDQQAEETSIITATGPCLIEWNLKRILQRSTILYKMKRYAEDIKAEEFRHGSDKAVLVALSNGVDMITVQSCRTSTKGRSLWDSGEAISGISCLGHGKYNLN
ncbi:uncharacterized protein FFNC_15633 [Fusarium fujikuroi]|nr:uncharacterized protein FFNC_15633 [Fusarium fujikuroi]